MSERAELEQLRREAWAARSARYYSEAEQRTAAAIAAAAEGPSTFQVVYQASDRLIIGVGPFEPGTDFGSDYPIAELSIDQESAVLSNATAYLCADGATVQPEPC